MWCCVKSPQKLRDHLLVNSQQFESDYNKLKAIIQAYLNTNKTWIANDFSESDRMEVEHTSNGKSKGKSKSKSKGNSKGSSKGGSKSNSKGQGKSKCQSRDRSQSKGKSKSKGKGKGSGKPDNDRECHVCGERGHFARDGWSRANYDKMVNEVVNAETGKYIGFTIENVISDVTLSQDGCVEREDGLVMIDSGASVNVCPKWFGKSKLQQSDGATRLKGVAGKPLQKNGERQVWLKIGGQTKRYDFHVVHVTKPILSVSYLCEHGAETHLAKQPFLRSGDGHEPLIRRGGVYFVKAQMVNAAETVTQDESEKSCVRAEDSQKCCVRAEDSQNRCVRAEDSQNAQNRCVRARYVTKTRLSSKSRRRWENILGCQMTSEIRAQAGNCQTKPTWRTVKRTEAIIGGVQSKTASSITDGKVEKLQIYDKG